MKLSVVKMTAKTYVQGNSSRMLFEKKKIENRDGKNYQPKKIGEDL